MSTSIELNKFWNQPVEVVLKQLDTSAAGLTNAEADNRLKQHGVTKKTDGHQVISLLIGQFTSPLVLLLLMAAGLSFFLGDHTDALVIMLIVGMSGCLGFWQEWGAHDAVKKMLALVQTKANIIRNGSTQEISFDLVMPGDIVQLSVGDTIPGDCLILESKDLFVDEAALTGETFPAEKHAGIVPVDAVLSHRTNSLFKGTHVISGAAKAIIVHIGEETEFGKVSQRLETKSPETDFEKGIRLFGYFLVKLTLVFVFVIFATNILLKRPVLESFMFSLALAVGLTPQLLPAIISVNLAGGARRMAKCKVIVKRLAAIESFGSMNVLCSDKTGTITEGIVQLEGAFNIEGEADAKVLLYAYLNSSMETGFANPIDQSLRQTHVPEAQAYTKLDEVPYDFNRKRLSVLVSKDNAPLMITKGAMQNILDVCTQIDSGEGKSSDITAVRAQILKQMQEYSAKGSRVLGVAYKAMQVNNIKATDEQAMTFAGLLVFTDPPKENIDETIKALNDLGIALKIITGDNHMVAQAVALKVGFPSPKIMTATEFQKLSASELLAQVNSIDVFAEIEPNQKEAIILALKQAGNVVGYIGDGINDASALHAADIGISVNNAVDVAKEAAQLVMMDHDLSVLLEGVKEGRKTFANTMKYIFMAISANFGSMFSMAGASLLLPFLPQLPKQVLLSNLMADFPEMTIVTDSVDAELVGKPEKWDLQFIRSFMVVFGVICSFFDYLTFAVLLFVFKSGASQFRTAWFVESVVSSCLIVLVVRTRKPFIMSLPSLPLAMTNLAVVGITLALPYASFNSLLGFEPLPLPILGALAAIVAIYVLTAEIGKHFFYRCYRPTL